MFRCTPFHEKRLQIRYDYISFACSLASNRRLVLVALLTFLLVYEIGLQHKFYAIIASSRSRLSIFELIKNIITGQLICLHRFVWMGWNLRPCMQIMVFIMLIIDELVCCFFYFFYFSLFIFRIVEFRDLLWLWCLFSVSSINSVFIIHIASI